MTAHASPASAPSAGLTVLDTGWRLPRALRPRAADLPALAWLLSRRTGPTDGSQVDPWRAAAFLPACLVLLVGQHAAGTLAARGRQALVALSPTWPAARGHRTTKAAAIVAAAAAALLLVVVAVIGVESVVALALPQHDGTAGWVPLSLMALWGAGLLTHPGLAATGRQVPVWRRSETYRGAGVMVVHTLVGIGRPSLAAGRLGLEVVAHIDERGWTLVTNSGVQDRTGGQYERAGFAWLPDGSRRMLRHAQPGPRLVDVVAVAVAELAARAGVRLDEVRLVDDDAAESWRAAGRAVITLPVRYLTGGTLSPAGRAALAHELGHHHLQHFTAEQNRARQNPKLLAVGLAAGASVAGVLTAVISGRDVVCALGVLVAWAVVFPGGWWIGDAAARRGEYNADQYAARAVGVTPSNSSCGRCRTSSGTAPRSGEPGCC